MEKLKSLTSIYTNLLSSEITFSDETRKSINERYYQLEIQPVNRSAYDIDSSFFIYCVFNKKDLRAMNYLVIRSGTQHELFLKESISLKDSGRVVIKNDKVFLEMGEVSKVNERIEIYAKDNNGIISIFKYSPDSD